MPLFAMTALLLATGCGTVGEFLVDALKDATKQAIQTAASQAVENAVGELGGGLQDLVTEGVVDSLTP